MNLKEYVQQYKNDELCKKWDNNIPSREISIALELVQDSRNIEDICSQFSFLPAEDITGALVSVRDGDYGEVYVTESSRPYSLDAIYHPLDYYL